MKFQMLATMVIAVLAFSACGDDDKNDGIDAPDAIVKAMKDKYPAATNIEWEKKGNYFVADCWNNGKELDVWFNTNAIWQLTETGIAWADVPAAVQTAFVGGEYASWNREGYDVLESPLQPIEYVIEVEQNNSDYQLFYSENGELMQARNVTGKDDTHWPK